MGSRFCGSDAEIRALSALINLFRAAGSLGAIHSRRVAKQGLTLSQFGVLEALYHLGPMSQTMLGQKLLKTSGDMTMVVNNLEKRTLVARRRGTEDRRFVTIHLTPKGKRLIERVMPAHAAAVVEDFAQLTPADQDELRRLCRILGKRTED